MLLEQSNIPALPNNLGLIGPKVSGPLGYINYLIT